MSNSSALDAKEIINLRIASYFNLIGVITGYIFLLAGVILIPSLTFTSIALVFLGLFFAFSYTGVQFDTRNKQFREYACHFWIKIGKWKPMSLYPYLTLTVKREALNAQVKAQEMTIRNKYHCVCLLTHNHLKRIEIAKFEESDKALEKAKELSFLLDLPLVNFNPVSSRRKR